MLAPHHGTSESVRCLSGRLAVDVALWSSATDFRPRNHSPSTGRLFATSLSGLEPAASIGNPLIAGTILSKAVLTQWFLLRVRSASVTCKKSVRRTVSSGAEAWKAQHVAIALNYHKAELEMIDLRKRIKALEAQNEALLDQLELVDRSKVMPLPTRGK